MSNLGKWVVYWVGSGTNTHHYFDSLDEAEKYCEKSVGSPEIAFVTARFWKKQESEKVPRKNIACLLKEKDEYGN